VDLGSIGGPGSAPRKGDLFVVKASAPEAFFACLLGVNPDGRIQVLHADQQAVEELSYPEDPTEYETLDKVGPVAIMLLANRGGAPLPFFDPVGPGWQPSRDWEKQTGNWLFDGRRVEPVRMERFGKTPAGPQPFADLCKQLRRKSTVETVRGVLFQVKP
jgi:hypothetical protein